ncbi:TetR/AcrR family transcriptional regulator [Terrimonas sp. NA20]|uniref:TetR/AcrR family transcriptional regulator n=1 Tax=Terrimonas ginsenosidimutans TaxID=2908004 RepID=A0ABS9KUZ3_9BACT|nr:TetR/AcrR family transcriptional regulator [Terrimonas ginsenosidimutans]MCG2616133.1 TetR/AcrR family transcriptional regulator [Terrimonas ginsenosidimutans]
MAKIQRRKASKKDLILQKAALMFREKGFAATSMRDLAETVGIEAASLYNHIQSKSEILQDITFRMATDCNEHLASLDNNGMNSTQKIESLIRFHVQMMINRFEDYYVMVNEWIHLSEPHLTEFSLQRRNYVQKMEDIIRQGIDNKEMKAVIPYVAVLTILSSVRGLEFWHRSRQHITPVEMEDNMVNHLINGLKN